MTAVVKFELVCIDGVKIAAPSRWGKGSRARRRSMVALWREQNECCAICGEWIDLTCETRNAKSLRAPSLDHIIPKSMGGTYHRGNLRLTHRGCNANRQNSLKDLDSSDLIDRVSKNNHSSDN